MEFFRDKKVFVTGHTGFKGSWLCQWLNMLGARVTGFSKDIPSTPSLFEILGLQQQCIHVQGDIRNRSYLHECLTESRPDLVFHLAAQPIVSQALLNPLETFETNIIGTANLIDGVSRLSRRCSVVVVTSDKCYRESLELIPYSEESPLGGGDPYSASKACAEIVTSSYYNSYLKRNPRLTVATARAGNVIGGGDWGKDRLLTDIARAYASGSCIQIRSPQGVRPWQHVLDALHGYLLLARYLWDRGSEAEAEAEAGPLAFNFGPGKRHNIAVSQIVDHAVRYFGNKFQFEHKPDRDIPDAGHLAIDPSRASEVLNWRTAMSTEEAVERTFWWYRQYYDGDGTGMDTLTKSQIAEFQQKFTGKTLA